MSRDAKRTPVASALVSNTLWDDVAAKPHATPFEAVDARVTLTATVGAL